MPPELVDALRSQLRDLLADDESEEGTCRPRKSRPGTGPFSALLALKNQLSDSDPNSDAAAARRLQRTYKACVTRRGYLQTKKAVRVIQSHRRGLTTRRQVAYDRAATTPADVFITHRVVESHHAALALKKALEERGLTVFVPNSFAHKDNAIKIAIQQCKVAIVLATRDFGRLNRQSARSYSTAWIQMRQILDTHKTYYLVRMLPHDEPFADEKVTLAFPPTIMYKLWLPQSPLPDEITDEVCKLVEAKTAELGTPFLSVDGAVGALRRAAVKIGSVRSLLGSGRSLLGSSSEAADS